MELELKHGDLKVNLSVCNYSYKLAIAQAQEEGTIDNLANSQLRIVMLTNNYIYHSYCVYCKLNKLQIQYNFIEFDELISETDIDPKESNYGEVFEKVAESIVSTLNKGVDNLKKNIEHKKVDKKKKVQ